MAARRGRGLRADARPAATPSPRPFGHELCQGRDGEPPGGRLLRSRERDPVQFHAHQAGETDALAVGEPVSMAEPAPAGLHEENLGPRLHRPEPEGDQNAAPAGSAVAQREQRLRAETTSALRLMEGAMDSSGGSRSTRAA